MIRNKKVGKGVFKVLTGVVIGGAIGSILGLTLAPKKGTDTRKAIRDKSLEMFLKGKTEIKKQENLDPVRRVIIKALKPKKKPVAK